MIREKRDELDGANLTFKVLELLELEDVISEDLHEGLEAEVSLLDRGDVSLRVPRMFQRPRRELVLVANLVRLGNVGELDEHVAQDVALREAHYRISQAKNPKNVITLCKPSECG